MDTISVKAQQIAASLDDKEYAHVFVSSEINTLLPFQLREMRRERRWSQTKVAELTGQNQKTISDFENPNYARYSLNSLRRLAEAFDVALIVRFAPFSELVDWAAALSPAKLRVPSRTKDERLRAQRRGAASETAPIGEAKPEIVVNASAKFGGGDVSRFSKDVSLVA